MVREESPLPAQSGDSVTVAGAELLAQTYRAVLDAIARRRRDGLPTADLLQLARALRGAHDEAVRRSGLSPHMSLERHEGAVVDRRGACCDHQQSRDDWCTTGEAAILLGLSRRSVQRLAKAPGGLEARRAGRTWLLRTAPLLVQARERRTRDRRSG